MPPASRQEACAPRPKSRTGSFRSGWTPEKYSVFEQPIRQGLAAAGRSAAEFDVAPFVTVVIGDNVEECMRPIRGTMALYIGGMGARKP